MNDRQEALVALAPGERRQVAIEAATTVLVVAGRVLLRGPCEWLAETVVVPEQWLCAEQASVIPSGGWVDLMAPDGARLVLIASAKKPWWRRLKP